MSARIPTDLALLKEIYNAHYQSFADYSNEHRTRSSKIWMPVDIDRLAEKFSLDPDIVFGRLYYHLNDKFAHNNADGSKSEFFAIRVGSDHHCVNFPYLASILASLQDEQKKFLIATGIASVSLVISILSILVALLN